MTTPPAPHAAPVPRRTIPVPALAWAASALALGTAIGWLDMPAREYESGVLLYLLAGFWLALPGRAPSTVLAIACGLAPQLARYLFLQGTRPVAVAAAFVLTFAGAAAGRFAGARLMPGADAEPVVSPGTPWHRRPVDARTLLALALSAIAAAGLVPVFAALRRAMPVTLSTVRGWQAATFVGWVLLAPTVLRLRTAIARRSRRGGEDGGLSPAEAAAHLGLAVAITLVHAALLAATAFTVGGGRAPWPAAFRATAVAYLPLDLLAYTAVLGLAYLSDTRRQAEDARRRAAALQAAVLSTRLEALRARLNPHFLYNALNAAVMLARAGRGRETSRVLEELTALLRYVLDETGDRVPLEREVAFVRRYLEIQQVRFGERLRWEVTVDERASSAAVPPLVLQPIVENAVEHAVASEGGGTIAVTASRDGDALVLAVEDDGPGPDGARIDASGGIGLGATRERLAALYGGRASVTLRPRPPGGTLAEIRLPIDADAVARREDAPAAAASTATS
jgi:signal transduction histidine kinase